MRSQSEESWFRGLLTLGRKFALIDDSPERIARGFAIGVFWGIMPTFGFACLFSLPTAFLLKANKLSSILGTFVSNPFTAVFFYSLGYKVGARIFHANRIPFSWNVFDWQFFASIGGSLKEGIVRLGAGDLSVLLGLVREIQSYVVGSGIFASMVALFSYVLLLLILLVIIPLFRKLRTQGHS